MAVDPQRFRITFSKGGALTYTSHLDLMRVWERSIRRAGIPLAYSRGFNPRPKLQLAAALPLGHTGEAELLDVQLERPISAEAFAKALVPALTEGLAISQVTQVEPKEPALQTQVVSAEYRVTVEWGGTVQEIEACIETVLAATELTQKRRGRQYDLRPLIERLWLERADEDTAVLRMQLAARQGATGRPEAVLKALGMAGAFARYHRLRLRSASDMTRAIAFSPSARSGSPDPDLWQAQPSDLAIQRERSGPTGTAKTLRSSKCNCPSDITRDG